MAWPRTIDQSQSVPNITELNQGITMTTTTLTTPSHNNRVRRRPGRRKAVGTLDFSSGVMMWVLGYCSDCDGKVLVDRAMMDGLKLAIDRTKKAWQYRLLLRLVKHYKDKTM